jgi:hypothetical protein
VPDVLIRGDTVRSPELRHELPLAVPDPVLYVERDGRRHAVLTAFEVPRIEELGLDVEALRRYGRRDLKSVQAQLTGFERLHTLEQEEAVEPGDPREWGLLYLRANRRDARSQPAEPAPPG